MKKEEGIEQKTKSEPRFVRSRIYPRYGLGEVISFLKMVDKLGGKKISQNTLLTEMGKKSASDPIFSGKISSAKQFGLLAAEKGAYSITEKGLLLLNPTPETDERKLLVEAFSTPPIYKELIERFKNKELPQKGSLGNILLIEFGISKNAKNRAASVFIKSADFAGVLQEGRLNIRKDYELGTETEISTLPESKIGELTLQIPLTQGIARISIPRDTTEDELDRITMALKALIGSDIKK